MTTPYYQDEQTTLWHGDAAATLAHLDAGSIDCIVTSPPYFGLRSYLPDAVQLRDDLSDVERSYVLAEIERLGIG